VKERIFPMAKPSSPDQLANKDHLRPAVSIVDRASFSQP
jgi:hypothetical protein